MPAGHAEPQVHPLPVRLQAVLAPPARRLHLRGRIEVLARVGTVPRDGTLLREAHDAGVFVMLGGRKHKVTACIDSAHVLWAGALAAIP